MTGRPIRPLPCRRRRPRPLPPPLPTRTPSHQKRPPARPRRAEATTGTEPTQEIITLQDYLARLKAELAGSDPALVQDALYDAEGYLRDEMAAAGSSAADLPAAPAT